MTTYGTMNSAGRWADVPAEKLPSLFARIIERDNWMAPRQQRVPLTDADDVETYLATGQVLSYGEDWYQVLRAKQATSSSTTPPALVICTCGHAIQASSVMHASLGTSCPDCYDRFSN